MKYVRYRGRTYKRVATDMFGIQWFAPNEIKKLTDTLASWGGRENPKVGRVFWHDGKQKWALIPGDPSEKEVAEYLAHDDPKKFKTEQRELRPVSYSEIEDRCRRCMGVDWAKIKNVFKELQYRKRND